MHDLSIQKIDNGDNIHFERFLGQDTLKVFVCEYITGGGLYPGELPTSLAREGSLMRDAVLRDLMQLENIETICPHDQRLPAPELANTAVEVSEDAWSVWETCINQADAVLPIAPETEGALLRLTRMIEQHGKLLLGCSAEGVKLTSSKLLTCQTLQASGIDVVPTFKASAFPIAQYGQCVAKPDDGVGCEGTRLFAEPSAFLHWLTESDRTNEVAQPYVPGIAASLSMLCSQGHAWLLSCNRQKIHLVENQFVYSGSHLNAEGDHWTQAAQLARRIAAAIPTLSGYIGVDVILHGDRISVLEVNPRLTTSYAGLHQALGHNPAGLLLDLLYNCRFPPDSFKMPERSLALI